MPDSRRRFLAMAHQRVLNQLVSGWRRRGSSLVQIGLDDGLSPESFWEAGFDVTAVDASPARLQSSLEQTGPKVGYVCARPEHLPFGDAEFDYAVLVHQGLGKRTEKSSGDGMPPELDEALRVAASGVIILEWNRFSLPGVPRAAMAGERPASTLPWGLWSMLRRACPERRIRYCSALPLWECTWPGEQGGRVVEAMRNFLLPLNLFPSPLPAGALLAVRVDWTSVPLTPAGMLRSAAEKLCPAKPREELASRRSTAACFSHNERKGS